MLILLVLASAVAAVRADCDACIQGMCHSKKVLIEGFQITDQIAIDRTDNILYAQLDYRTTAIFLDEAKIRIVHTVNTTGLAVDQETQLLYSSLDGAVYAHKYQKGGYITEPAFDLDQSRKPVRLRYEDTLYTINEDGSSAYFSKTSKSFAGYDNLENFAVTDMANVQNITHWFFISNNKLYKYIFDGGMSWRLISDKKHVLSIGKKGDVYFGDASEKVIYKLDRETGELVNYASYMDGSVEDFVFDRDEKIVFVDADGSIRRWVASGEDCITPHRDGADFAESQRNDDMTYLEGYQRGFYVVEFLENRKDMHDTYTPAIDSNSVKSQEIQREQEVDAKLVIISNEENNLEW